MRFPPLIDVKSSKTQRKNSFFIPIKDYRLLTQFSASVEVLFFWGVGKASRSLPGKRPNRLFQPKRNSVQTSVLPKNWTFPTVFFSKKRRNLKIKSVKEAGAASMLQRRECETLEQTNIFPQGKQQEQQGKHQET